jgi:hypothetical protein
MKAKRTPRVPLGLAAALGLLAACQSAPKPQRSEAPLPAEIAQRLETVRGERPGYPGFGDVPPPPANVRTAEQWREFVVGVEGTGGELQAWPVQNPVARVDISRYVAGAQAATAPGGPPPPPDQQARTEAWAERMRQLARPPAPPQ